MRNMRTNQPEPPASELHKSAHTLDHIALYIPQSFIEDDVNLQFIINQNNT